MQLVNFFKKFSSKPRVFLGLDLDHQSMRLAQLAKVDNALELHSCQQFFFPQQNSTTRFSWEHPEFPPFLKYHAQQANLVTHQVALALPHQSVLFKTIELDKTLCASEIALQVHSAAELYFNYPLDELMLDFEVLGDSKRDAALQQVRWVAARRAEVELRVDALSQAGLTAVAIEVDAFSLARTALFFMESSQQPRSAMTAVIHLGALETLLIVIKQGQVIQARTEHYDLSAQGSLAAINAAILRLLQLYLNPTAADTLSLILLSGSFITAEFLAEVQAQTGIGTRYLDALLGIKVSVEVKPETCLSHEFALAIGLAMRVDNER